MGTTLENGIYLPDEGERNCYDGLAGNWVALDNHLGSTDIHVTINDKQAWNGHVADSVKHVTAEDKAKWNTVTSKADASALTAHTGDTTIHVTAEDKAKWDAVTSKADDSDVVHRSGNETIAGVKTFSDKPLVGNNNTNITISNRQITANGSASTTGNHAYSYMHLQAKVSYADSSSPIDVIVALDINEDAYADGKKSSLSPSSNNITNLGKSGKRWANVYATNYYYGSSETEFSTKFVTTDTAQTVSGSKTFSSDLNISNTNTTANTPNLNLRNYKVDRGTTETGVQTITFLDKNAKALTLIESRRISNGSTGTNIFTYSTDDSNNTVSGGVSIIKSKTDTIFAPNADNAVTCGRPLAKWSDVQTNKINALEPSSLSLPGYTSPRIDISSYITNLTGGGNDYIAPSNGYIFVRTTNGTYLKLTEHPSGVISSVCSQTADDIGTFIPVLAGRTCIIQIKCSSINRAYFIPCLGNV